MTPIIFGEILFDEFPDGVQVLGGAPFNVAWHLNAFKLNPVLISRVGNDNLGKKIHQSMEAWQMQTSGLQIDPELSTGRVIITFTDSSHRFEIPANQAFDFIDSQNLPENIEKNSLLYFGSLCLRNDVSRNALKKLLTLPLKHFIDINLRAPWWNDEVIALVLANTHWLKVNDEELKLLTSDTTSTSIESNITSFYQLHAMHTLIVTCGENGAYFYDGNTLIHDNIPKKTPVKDTIGAGDAFSAVVIYGIHQNWPMKIILKRAMLFAADICGIQGATTSDATFYQRHTQNWKD